MLHVFLQLAHFSDTSCLQGVTNYVQYVMGRYSKAFYGSIRTRRLFGNSSGDQLGAAIMFCASKPAYSPLPPPQPDSLEFDVFVLPKLEWELAQLECLSAKQYPSTNK